MKKNLEAEPKTILAVLAHPDDETFGLGGTLALYASRGHAVHLVCATRGESGTVDPEYLAGYDSIAALREVELRCAAQKLGLAGVEFLGYRDSGMPGTPENEHPNAQIGHSVDEVAGKIVERIRRLKPDIVLTFDPAGGYRHPDHIHVQRATTLAFEHAGDSSYHPEAGAPFKPRALYYEVFPHKFLRFVTRIMPLLGLDPRHWGRNKDIDLKALTDLDFPIHVKIDIRAVRRVKAEAGACHASQGGIQMRKGLMGLVTRYLGRHEDYMRAFPPPTNHQVARDLFEGI